MINDHWSQFACQLLKDFGVSFLCCALAPLSHTGRVAGSVQSARKRLLLAGVHSFPASLQSSKALSKLQSHGRQFGRKFRDTA